MEEVPVIAAQKQALKSFGEVIFIILQTLGLSEAGVARSGVGMMPTLRATNVGPLRGRDGAFFGLGEAREARPGT